MADNLHKDENAFTEIDSSSCPICGSMMNEKKG